MPPVSDEEKSLLSLGSDRRVWPGTLVQFSLKPMRSYEIGLKALGTAPCGMWNMAPGNVCAVAGVMHHIRVGKNSAYNLTDFRRRTVGCTWNTLEERLSGCLFIIRIAHPSSLHVTCWAQNTRKMLYVHTVL
jgi:hypothetical protein